MNLDPLDISAPPLVDLKADAGEMGGRIAQNDRLDLRKGKADPAELRRHRFRRFDELAVVEDVTLLRQQQGTQAFAVQLRDVARQLDRAEPIGGTFLDRECHIEAAGRSVIIDIDARHLGIGIAVISIILPQLFAIRIDPVGVIDVAAGDKAQQVRRRCLDDGLQLSRAIGMIADKPDASDGRFLALRDREHQVDAFIAAIDDLGDDTDVVASDTVIGFDDASHVALHGCALQSSSRF